MDDYDQDFESEMVDLHEGDHGNRTRGKAAVKRRYSRTVDDAATELETDANPLAEVFDTSPCTTEIEAVEPLLRKVDDDTRKKQHAARLATAWQGFDKALLDDMLATPAEPPLAANDNSFKHKESWPLEEAIKRSGKANAQELLGTAHFVRDVYDSTCADPLADAIHRPGKAATPDFGVQRSASGEVFYEHGRTLDRKRKAYDGRLSKRGKPRPSAKDGEEGAIRHDGFARRVKKPPVDTPFNVIHDDLFSQRRIDAQNDLRDILAAVGPLWGPLVDACCHNLTFAEIAAQKGYKRSGEGSVLVWEALEAAHAAIEAKHNAANYREYVSNSGLPVSPKRDLRLAA
jgi:hypothetical protein